MQKVKNDFWALDNFGNEFKINYNSTNFNIFGLCSFEYYKTIYINNLYLNLIPLKIKILKETKNKLLMLKNNIPKVNKETYIKKKNLYATLKPVVNSFKVVSSFYPDSIGKLNKKFPLLYRDLKTYFSIKYKNDIGINQDITLIEKQIRFYYNELKHKSKRAKFKINVYDLTQLKKGVITKNVYNYIYFYLIKIKKTSASARERLFYSFLSNLNDTLNYRHNAFKDCIMYKYVTMKTFKLDSTYLLRNEVLKYILKDNVLNNFYLRQNVYLKNVYDYSNIEIYKKHLDAFKLKFLMRE
jgi:hypothetical protein